MVFNDQPITILEARATWPAIIWGESTSTSSWKGIIWGETTGTSSKSAFIWGSIRLYSAFGAFIQGYDSTGTSPTPINVLVDVPPMALPIGGGGGAPAGMVSDGAPMGISALSA